MFDDEEDVVHIGAGFVDISNIFATYDEFLFGITTFDSGNM